MTKDQRRKTILPAMKLCILPVLLFCAAMIAGWKLQELALDRTVYRIPAVAVSDEGFGCEESTSYLVCREFDPPRNNLEDDIDIAVSRIEGVMASKILSAADMVISAESDAQQAERAFSALVWEGDEAIIPIDITGFSSGLVLHQSCGVARFLWSLVTLKTYCIERNGLNLLNDLYTSLREALKNRYEERVKAAGDLSGQGAEAFRDIAVSFVEDDLGSFFEELRLGISALFDKLNLINISVILLQLLVLCKVIMLIFARFIFHPDHGARPIRSLERSVKIKPTAKILTKDITRENRDRDGLKRSFSLPVRSEWYAFPKGVIKPTSEGRLTVPRPFQLIFVRLLRGAYFAECFERSKHSYFGAIGDANSAFMLIRLQPGQQISIRLDSLFAFSDGVRLRSIYDYSLATVTRRSLFLRVVEGVGNRGGWVVLCAENGGFQRMRHHRSNAGQDLHEDGRLSESIPPEGLIAFDPRGAFVLDADTGALGTYKGKYSLWPADDRTTAIYATTRKQYRGWVMFKRLLLILVPLPF